MGHKSTSTSNLFNNTTVSFIWIKLHIEFITDYPHFRVNISPKVMRLRFNLTKIQESSLLKWQNWINSIVHPSDGGKPPDYVVEWTNNDSLTYNIIYNCCSWFWQGCRFDFAQYFKHLIAIYEVLPRKFPVRGQWEIYL